MTLADPLIASIPVVQVTLLEDRGIVKRSGSLTLPPGRSRLRIEDVAPALVDKTLAAAIDSADVDRLADTRVQDTKIERWRITADTERPSDVAAIRTRIREAEAEQQRRNFRLRSIDREVALVQELHELSLVELCEDAGWAREPRASASDELDEIESRLIALGGERCDVAQQMERAEQNLRDLRTLATASDPVGGSARAAIVVELLHAGSDPVSITLRIEYVVPGALWRPWHTAQLIETSNDGKALLRFRTDGCVWQATGEDWTDVDLRFSTERPSLGARPPALATDRLQLFAKRNTVDVEAREHAVQTTGLGADGTPAGDNGVEPDHLPGMDDGGHTLDLRSPARVTVRSDGLPHRVPLFGFEAPAETTLVCIAERVAAAVLRSRQTNRAEYPLLAGPVDLVRNSGLVGRTSILFVSQGERFDLGFGPDSSIRIHREVEELEPERRSLSSWTRKPTRVRVKLSRLAITPCTIEVTERIPVSEIPQVKVELTETAPKASPDSDGFIRWTMRLPGLGQDVLSYRFALVVHDEVAGV